MVCFKEVQSCFQFSILLSRNSPLVFALPLKEKNTENWKRDLPSYITARSLQSDRYKKKLHWMSTLAALEVSFPRLLFATHRYSPLSVLFTFVIVNCFLSSAKLILAFSLVSTGNPSLFHDTVGAGFPVTLQDNVKSSPSVFVWAFGWTVISGWSTITKISRYKMKHNNEMKPAEMS